MLFCLVNCVIKVKCFLNMNFQKDYKDIKNSKEIIKKIKEYVRCNLFFVCLNKSILNLTYNTVKDKTL